MKTKSVWIAVMIVMVLLAPSLVSCAGNAPNVIQDSIAPLNNQVIALQLGSTVWGMKQAMMNAPGTLLVMRDNCIVFGWAVKDAFAFVGVNATTLEGSSTLEAVIGKGNVVNAKTMSEFSKFLAQEGFKPITAEQVPEALRVILAGTTSTMGKFLGGYKTFLVLPAGLIPDGPTLDGYQKWQM